MTLPTTDQSLISLARQLAEMGATLEAPSRGRCDECTDTEQCWFHKQFHREKSE
jgi:hypothetical protein